MSRKYRVLCGTPQARCTGGHLTTDQDLGTTRCHSSHTEAFRCYARWLVNQGYTRIGGREFRPSDGGPILVLTKQSRYGSRLRAGKEGRFMPSNRNQGTIVAK